MATGAMSLVAALLVTIVTRTPRRAAAASASSSGRDGTKYALAISMREWARAIRSR